MSRSRVLRVSVPMLAVLCMFLIAVLLGYRGSGPSEPGLLYGLKLATGAAADSDDGLSASTSDLVEVTLSEEAEREMFARVWGAAAAARAHRVAGPVSVPLATENRRYATITNCYNLNYCGYESHVSGIVGAKGTFTVRYNTSGVQASWIGLMSSSNILQTGIDGSNHYAWIEHYPADPDYIFPVNQNDVINASVGRDVYTGYIYAVIYDVTTGDYASSTYSGTPYPYGCWIVEAPTLNIGGFGTINFSWCKWWNAAGTQSSISTGTGTVYKDIIGSSGSVIVAPSSLSGGTAFTVTR
jgi:hypothetical protein